jgi:hypothetical protein
MASLTRAIIAQLRPSADFIRSIFNNCSYPLGQLLPEGNPRQATGFEVKELRGGKSSAHFTYRVVAKRKGFENARFEAANDLPKPPPSILAKRKSAVSGPPGLLASRP